MSKYLLLLIAVSIVHATLNKGYKPKTGEDIFPFINNHEKPIEITTRVGEYFSLQIRGNPSTGYLWYLENPKNLELVKPEDLNKSNRTTNYDPDAPSSCLRGAGGSYYFRFFSKTKGKQTLTFIYKKSYEKNPKDKYTVNLIIN